MFPNKINELHTTHSWEFLGLEKSGGVVRSGSIWKKAKFGEDIIIGSLDTGVWPESESFSDEGYGPVPSKWKGSCQNNTKEGVVCNRKLIGARYYNEAFRSLYHPLPPNSVYHSPRDYEGHGTHTLSTAGGNLVNGVSLFGFANGTAKGGSPKARVAVYKVAYPALNETARGGCTDGDLLAGFDAAIHDGVDVISLSIGAPPGDYFKSGSSIGALEAVKKGIIVVASAGNWGTDRSVANVSPWLLTVAASTMDREFISYVALGDKTHLRGMSFSTQSLPYGESYPLISGIDAKVANTSAAELCKPNSLNPEKVKGKILVCLRGENGRTEKGQVAAQAGAVGMVLVNDMSTGSKIELDEHLLPATHISYTDGLTLISYMKSTKLPTASITPSKTEIGTKPAPVMGIFSSRGPNNLTQQILKPDITAPGVNILAAFTQTPGAKNPVFNQSGAPYQFFSGTSMSCPHVAGIAGLLKSIHPDWSPAAIKSAIMTTAWTRGNNGQSILNPSLEKATPFNYGAGQIRPNRAMDPGLVYDLTPNDYLRFLCGIGYNETILELFSRHSIECKSRSLNDFNYPSITVPDLSGTVTLTRTVKNVGSPGTYTVSIYEPAGISVTVEPTTLKFDKIGEKNKYSVTLKAKKVGAASDYVFGRLKWSDGKHNVRSPIVVKSA